MENAVNIKNKRAAHEYFLLQEFTAGIQLLGTEIKSFAKAKLHLQIHIVPLKEMSYS
jgi:tmRNA-binding protein